MNISSEIGSARSRKSDVDSWYASQKLIAMIDNLGKIYYCTFNRNRLVDDTKKTEKYTQIEKVQYKESELKSGKLNFLIC